MVEVPIKQEENSEFIDETTSFLLQESEQINVG
jgi:hypothetical protein